MQNYSQNNEQQIILDYFKDKVGSFLDAGANDGKTFSNTRALVELGWRGVLIEPSPKAYASLKENCKGFPVYTYPYALGTTNDMVKMWDSETHLNKGDHGLLSTMSEDDYNKWKGSTKFNEIEVKCFRWKTFLNRLKIKEFDFISVDCEGQDYNILSQIDLRSTSLVCVEHNGDPNKKLEFDKLMIGFRLLYTSSENLIYGR